MRRPHVEAIKRRSIRRRVPAETRRGAARTVANQSIHDGASPRRSRWPPRRTNAPWFPWQPHPRRTQCGVGANDGFVTNAECARTRIPDAPLPPPSQGTRLRASGVSRFLLPTFLCGWQRKVGAAPHRGNANRPLENQGKANANTNTIKPQPQAPSRQKHQPSFPTIHSCAGSFRKCQTLRAPAMTFR
ncbi:UNVERIFIED_ORG: hypothetical protein ABIC62_002171 [Burkholderia sp. 1595]|uniref:Uncharacterized protein n=1 Tax=Paraburkholderia terricola TaxID=169427 RepID=A0ABU1LTC2_9BURK|nr:hypothetical protein [Paraburkholderia terricola]MDR6480871.1 hypothetical protein [Paraburkholderia terricola]